MADKDNKKEDNGQITRLKFTSKEDGGGKTFEVMINPESITRHLNMKKTENKEDVYGADYETFSFDFYLDGTGVVPTQNGQLVGKQLENFLSIVNEKKGKNKDVVASFKMEYLGNTFILNTNSIDITYSLFDTQGLPLRAKVSCSFSEADKDESGENGGSPSDNNGNPQAEVKKPKECDCNEARSKGCSSLYEQIPDNAIGQRTDGSYIYMN